MTIPRAPGFDHTSAFARAPYKFISQSCERLGSDFFETRLFLTRTVCMRGQAAADLFYDDDLFERSSSAPGWLLRSVLGRDNVLRLDSRAPRARRTLFLSLLDESGIAKVRRRFAEEWTAALPWWEVQGEVVLFEEVQMILTRVACAWTGVPLAEIDVTQRTHDLALLSGSAGRLRPLEVLLARRRIDTWLRELIRSVRRGGPSEGSHSALERLARSQLDEESAAQELLNLLGPVVALAAPVVFLALALHQYPHHSPTTPEERIAFIQEVRRFYPLLPAVAGRVRRAFEWRGVKFPLGRRVLLDVYGTNHHPLTWPKPHEFRPERFANATLDPDRFMSGDEAQHQYAARYAGEQLTRAVLDEALSSCSSSCSTGCPAHRTCGSTCAACQPYPRAVSSCGT